MKQRILKRLEEINSKLQREIDVNDMSLPEFGKLRGKSEDEARKYISKALLLLLKQQILKVIEKNIIFSNDPNIGEEWLESAIEAAQAGLQVSLEKHKALQKDMISFMSELKKELISYSCENANK